MHKHSVKSGGQVPAQLARQPGLASSLRELLLLGKLLVRSCSEMELLHALHEFSEDETPITMRVFASLLKRLQADQFISQPAPAAPNQDQAIYSITSDGSARFQYLMSNGQEDLRSRQIFRAKLLYLDHVAKSTRRRIARSYMQRVVCAQIKAIEMHGFFQHDAKLPGSDRTMMLRVIRRERAIAEAEIKWMRADLARYL